MLPTLTTANGPFLSVERLAFMRALSRQDKYQNAFKTWWRRRELNPRPKQMNQPRLHA